MRIRLAVLCIALSAAGIGAGCEVAESVAADPPALVRPAPPLVECAVGGPARSFEGRAPALASNAVVVHTAHGRTSLHRLDEPSAPLRLSAPVLAMLARGEGWLVVMSDAVAELAGDGQPVWEAQLGAVATEAVMVLDADVAWVAFRDEAGEARVSRLDLLAHRPDPAAVIGQGPGRLLVAPGRATLAHADTPIWSEDAAELPAPGVTLGLIGAARIFSRPDRTGIWLDGEPEQRVAQPHVTPQDALVTPLGARLLLAYRAAGDIFVQLADRQRGAIGQPVLVARSARPAAIATVGERFWLAWEREGTVEVRAGDCEGGEP